MANVTGKGQPMQTLGTLPEVGSDAPEFDLVATDLSSKSLEDYRGKTVIMNIFPSLDTGTCAASVRAFNEKVSGMDETVVLCISRDLPFAQKRFCGAEGLNNVIPLSDFRDHNFGRSYEVEFTESPMRGLLSRAVVVVDRDGKVIHSQQVQEISDEPDYDAVLNSIK